jgi:ParB/RepB/Spo0J family partition protein
MAKRKRLTPARGDFLSASAPAPETKSALRPAQPPIAQVAGEAAAISALETLSQEWETARAEGRMVVSLPLNEVVADHLVRDRAGLDGEAMDSLRQSLLARGQQTPIEVMIRPDGGYGLISGWRRLSALKALLAETGEARFGTVQALVRQPADLAQSYVSMVEENEIRADLSFYERARIVVKALDVGVFPTEREALQSLFSTGSYARRSKIKSLIPVVRALEGALRFPERMTERTGLRLAKALAADAGVGARLKAALAGDPPETAEAETEALLAVVDRGQGRGVQKAGGAGQGPAPEQERAPEAGQNRGKADVRLHYTAGRITLQGAGVTPAFRNELMQWLRKRG